MLAWIPFIILASAAFAAADVFRKMLAPQLGGMVIVLASYTVAAVIAFAWLLFSARAESGSLLAQAVKLWPFLVANGAVLTLGVVAQVKGFAQGAPLSLAAPVLVVGLAVFASLAGAFLFHEPISLRWLAGFTLTLAGLVLLLSR